MFFLLFLKWLVLACVLFVIRNDPSWVWLDEFESVFVSQAHGFCHQGKNCKQSHDIDVILDQEDKTREAKKRRNRKRRRPQGRIKHQVLNYRFVFQSRGSILI